MTDTILLAALPLLASTVGWTIYKVISHEQWLVDMRDGLQRVEGKLDNLIDILLRKPL